MYCTVRPLTNFSSHEQHQHMKQSLRTQVGASAMRLENRTEVRTVPRVDHRWTNFPKIEDPPQNSKCKEGDKQQHRTEDSQTLVANVKS